MLQKPISATTFTQFTNTQLLDEISNAGTEYTFAAGEIVIDSGMPISFIPLLIKGVLRIIRHDENDNEILLYYLHPGQTCATSLTCCMSNQASEVSAIAEEDVTLIGIPANLADRWFDKFPEWKAFVMNTYKYRFDELLETINSIAFTQLDQRLAKYLVEKSEVRESKTLKTSHQEIAQDLNSSREVISRLLKQLEKSGKVELARNSVTLLTDKLY